MDLCPSRAEIDAAEKDRANAEARRISAHVAECDRCRARAARSLRDESLIEELRSVASEARRPSGADVGAPPGYVIEHELRRGGQGVVYAALQSAAQRRVAIKMLDRSRTYSARERMRFEREIELASRLRHPHVVTVHESGSIDGVPWFAMELVEGRTLDEWARETQPTLRARLELFVRIAAGVAYAHRRGVVHRDLKPANILVDAENQPRILDFGAAFDAASERLDPRVTAPGEFMGTLAYAAPEQLRGDGSDADTQTDVHALGLLLYELATSRLPYDVTSSVADMVERITRGSVAPPSESMRGGDADLDAIALMALEKDRSRRYATVDALQHDVERYLAGESVSARAQSAWYRVRKRLVRHRIGIAAALVVTVATASFSWAWMREHQRAERRRAESELVRTIFQDVLGAAAPQRMGGEVRLLEVFELAARSIDDSLRDAPDVQAAMELTIGDTYRRLLRPSEAVPHLRRALDRYRDADGASALDVARCAYLLGLALSDQNEPEAVAVGEEALAIRARELGQTHPLVAESRRAVAIALVSQFNDVDHARAVELLERALRDQVAALGDEHPDVAETKLWLARSLDEAEPERNDRLLSEALRALETHAPKDPRTVAALNEVASRLSRRGEFDEALALLDRSTRLTQELFGDELATDMLRRYARLAFARDEVATAEHLSRRAVARELERWAERRPEESTRLRALARRVEEPGSPSAEPPYAEAFAALRAIHGDGSFELAQWMNGIASTLLAQGRARAVEPLLREALAIRCRAMGADCPVRQRTIELLANGLLVEGRGREAVPELLESLATYARTGKSDSVEAASTERLFAECRSQTAAPPKLAR